MTLIDIVFIGIGLAMDAVAVSMTNGMVFRGITKAKVLAMPLAFGAFQAIMPVFGYFAGGLFAELISKYAGPVIFIILGIIGGKMLKEGLSRHENFDGIKINFTYKVLIFQAIATSIDAFAVGIGFNAVRVSIGPTVAIIGIITLVLSALAIVVGRKCGDVLGSKSEIFGGIILIIIGIKAII